MSPLELAFHLAQSQFELLDALLELAALLPFEPQPAGKAPLCLEALEQLFDGVVDRLGIDSDDTLDLLGIEIDDEGPVLTALPDKLADLDLAAFGLGQCYAG